MCQPKITAKKREKIGSKCPSKIPCLPLPGERGHSGPWNGCNRWSSEFVFASINIDLQNVQRSAVHQSLGSFSAKFSQFLLGDNIIMIMMSQKKRTTEHFRRTFGTVFKGLCFVFSQAISGILFCNGYLLALELGDVG